MRVCNILRSYQLIIDSSSNEEGTPGETPGQQTTDPPDTPTRLIRGRNKITAEEGELFRCWSVTMEKGYTVFLISSNSPAISIVHTAGSGTGLKTMR